MDSYFNYARAASGKTFIGRKKDISILCNLLMQGENIAIISSPKTGKTSLIQQTFLQLRLERRNLVTCEVEMLDIRDMQTFLRRMCDSVIRAFANTPTEFIGIMNKFFSGTHLVFDEKNYSERDEIISFNWDMDDRDVTALLNFPFSIAKVRDTHVYIILKEFQNIAYCDGYEKVLKAMESVIKEQKAEIEGAFCSFIMTGSRVNAMRDIFIHNRYFYRLIEKFVPGEIDGKEFTDYIVKGFLTSGKVIEREKIQGACNLFRGHPWYVNHFFSICDHLAKGYVMDSILEEALEILISIHEPRFESMVNELTTFQLSLLKAITEGNVKFSSAEVIQHYGLNSSANVKRLKDALMKKEIVTFDHNDEPQIIDPLFEYWVKKYFFHQGIEL